MDRKISYVLSNAVVTFPPLVLLSLAFATTTFFAVGLAGGRKAFLFFVAVMLSFFWVRSGFVTFLSAVVPQVMIGYTMVVAIVAYFSRVVQMFDGSPIGGMPEAVKVRVLGAISSVLGTNITAAAEKGVVFLEEEEDRAAEAAALVASISAVAVISWVS
ncbi:hypothetical protein PR202_gb25092 [Eleusine coracana subsp. coracana]|uniref:ABC-2 type transporter transmembrane domain-containing protein n=1 Tax=Eleusine coracana subsp. coracana TaxID=191504 RepID=A0AAV5FKG3_ELECO|nr:hypothetical protein PR202_gb25092 [Eleusine coracana subsp. coracana]